MKKRTNEELIIEAKSFFETYKKEIGESIRKGKKVVFVNFDDLASNSPVSIDGAFLKMANYKLFNDAYHVDCMLQVQESKALGIAGDVKPEIINVT